MFAYDTRRWAIGSMTIGACTSGAAVTVGAVRRSRSALCTCKSMSFILNGKLAQIWRIGISMRAKREAQAARSTRVR